MFIRQLEYIVMLAREQHFAKAALACHVSQPALSSAIRSLEEELGITIVKRDRKFLGFTPDGEKVLGWARQTLSMLSHMRQEASVAHTGLSGILRIGAIPTTMPVASLVTAPCRDEHPLIRFTLNSLSTEEIARQLDEYQLDVGMTYLEDRVLEGFCTQPLYMERYVLLSSNRNPVPGLVSWEVAANLPLCLLTPNMQNRRFINGAFRRVAAEPNVVLETDSLLAIYAHVAQGGLYSVIPHSLLEFFDPVEPVVVATLIPDVTRSIGLVARNHPTLAPMAAAILETASRQKFQERFDAILQERLGTEIIR